MRWILGAAVLLLAACSSCPPAEAPTLEAEAPPAVRIFVAEPDILDLPILDEQPIEFAALNAEIVRAWQAGQMWPTRAFDVAMRALGPIESSAAKIDFRSQPVESPEVAWVVVILTGLLDDSIAAVRYSIHLDLQLDQTWRIRYVGTSTRCARGGHTDAFSASPCP